MIALDVMGDPHDPYGLLMVDEEDEEEEGGILPLAMFLDNDDLDCSLLLPSFAMPPTRDDEGWEVKRGEKADDNNNRDDVRSDASSTVAGRCLSPTHQKFAVSVRCWLLIRFFST